MIRLSDFNVEFASAGIGVHHAGLTLDDRRTTEQLYLSKVLRILVATSVRVFGFVDVHT